MADKIFLGALPSDYDGGYRDTADGNEGTIPTYTPKTSDVTRSSYTLPSPMYQTFTPFPTDAASDVKTPNPTDVVTDKPADVGGGTDQKESPKPTDTGEEGEDDGLKEGFKISAPILILGAAAIYFFFFRKK